MADKVYRVTEIVGTSSESVENAVRAALGRASQTLRNLDWFEVVSVRGTIDGPDVGDFQVTLKVGFRLDD